jgi:hypothetical protein
VNRKQTEPGQPGRTASPIEEAKAVPLKEGRDRAVSKTVEIDGLYPARCKELSRPVKDGTLVALNINLQDERVAFKRETIEPARVDKPHDLSGLERSITTCHAEDARIGSANERQLPGLIRKSHRIDESFATSQAGLESLRGVRIGLESVDAQTRINGLELRDLSCIQADVCSDVNECVAGRQDQRQAHQARAFMLEAGALVGQPGCSDVPQLLSSIDPQLGTEERDVCVLIRGHKPVHQPVKARVVDDLTDEELTQPSRHPGPILTVA